MKAVIPSIENEDSLEYYMSTPSERAVEKIMGLKGDIVVLGVAGKVGITLAMMLARAVELAGTSAKVYGVSRFSDAAAKFRLDAAGVKTISCDLLDYEQVSKIPSAENVFFLAGRKFGTVGAQDLTWATNTIAPSNVAQRYAGCNIVAYSTGCVYDFATAASGGSTERDEPKAFGEYAQSTLGRERIFEYHSRKSGTRICNFRLYYAVDLRYGVLRDIADKVFESRPVDLSVSNLNCIWQGDVLERTILSLDCCASPPVNLNVTGPETASVRWIAQEFALRFGKPAIFAGEERADSRAYLGNAAQSFSLFGYPSVCLNDMIDMTADWVLRGGSSLGKPTHFEHTDGKY